MEKFTLIVGTIFIGASVGYVGMSLLWFIVKIYTSIGLKVFKQHEAIIDYIKNRDRFKKWKEMNIDTKTNNNE